VKNEVLAICDTSQHSIVVNATAGGIPNTGSIRTATSSIAPMPPAVNGARENTLISPNNRNIWKNP